MSLPPQKAHFPDTRWSMVRDSRGEGTVSRLRLEEFCRTYWHPVYACALGMGLKAEEAEDVTQDLFSKVATAKTMRRLLPEGGKLRGYLVAALRNVVNQRARSTLTQKRGGGAKVVSFDQQETESHFLADTRDNDRPERAFERRWALAVLDAALARLRSRYETRDEARLFEVLSPLLSDFERGSSFQEAAVQLNKTEGAVRMATFRMRKSYREMVREEVAATVADESQIESEIDALFRALQD